MSEKIAAAAGIEKKISYHTSRHTFAVLALAAGGDIYTVGKLLGHTSINSTQVYADAVMETKVEAISRISSYFPNNVIGVNIYIARNGKKSHTVLLCNVEAYYINICIFKRQT